MPELHSEHGMSGQSRSISCPGSVRMQRGLPNPDNAASALGTATHDMCEFVLNFGLTDCSVCEGMVFKGHIVDQKMIDSGNVYIKWVQEVQRSRPQAEILIEKKVKISSIDPDRLWGTSDLGFIDYSDRTLIVMDFKNGREAVEVMPNQFVYATQSYVKGNAQLMGYLLGVLDTFQLWEKVDNFIVGVVQPNYYHVDGEVRWVSIDREFVMMWWNVFQMSHQLAIDPNAPRHAGKHCKYCLARTACSNNIENLLKKLSLDDSIDEVDANLLFEIFELIPTFKKTLSMVEDKVTDLARKGMQVPGNKLVKAIVRANCLDEEALVKEAIQLGYKEEDLYNKRIKGKTEVKKMLGQKVANKYYVVPTAATVLAPMSDSRVAVMADNKPDATGIFNKVE